MDEAKNLMLRGGDIRSQERRPIDSGAVSLLMLGQDNCSSTWSWKLWPQRTSSSGHVP